MKKIEKIIPSIHSKIQFYESGECAIVFDRRSIKCANRITLRYVLERMLADLDKYNR